MEGHSVSPPDAADSSQGSLADARRRAYANGALVIELRDEGFSPVASVRERCDPAMAALIGPHITLTPPFLEAPDPAAIARIRTIARRWLPIDLVVGGVDRFEGTDVVYLRVEPAARLRQLHGELLATGLFEPDPHGADWEPHVTLSETPGGADRALEIGRALGPMSAVARFVSVVRPAADGRVKPDASLP